MSLDEFKTIYWWEWTHRLLARLIGAVFLLPFLFFLWRGWIEPRLAAAAVDDLRRAARCSARSAGGWWRPGLPARVSVSQYRLAFHLTLACAIYAAILWTAQRLVPRAAEPSARAAARRRARRSSSWCWCRSISARWWRASMPG